MLKVKLLEEGAIAPTVAHPGEDLCYDLYALEGLDVFPGALSIVRTGIAVEETNGYGFRIRERSGLAIRHGLFTHAGEIDPGYRGEILVLLTTLKPYRIEKGDKFAQMRPVQSLTSDVQVVESLGDSCRGFSGFGSSGTR